MMLWRVRVKFMHDLRHSKPSIDEGVKTIAWYAQASESTFFAIEAEDGYEAQQAALNLIQMERGPIGHVTVVECRPAGVLLPPNEVEDP